MAAVPGSSSDGARHVRGEETVLESLGTFDSEARSIRNRPNKRIELRGPVGGLHESNLGRLGRDWRPDDGLEDPGALPLAGVCAITALPQDFDERMARVMKLVRTQRTLPTQLEAATALAKRTVPACDAAGVSLVIVGEPVTSGATDAVVLEVDLVQYDTGQGPCLDAIEHSNVVRVDLIEAEVRYSRFAPGAMDAGINTIVSFPLTAGERTVGALNLYSRQTDAFNDETERAMVPTVNYASDVLATSPLYAYSLDLVDGLVATIDDQAAINQATGVLMVTGDLTSAAAFEVLRDRALVQGLSLREAAGAVLRTHTGVGAPKDQGAEKST